MQGVEKTGEQKVDPNLDEDEMRKVIDSVKDFLGRSKRNLE